MIHIMRIDEMVMNDSYIKDIIIKNGEYDGVRHILYLNTPIKISNTEDIIDVSVAGVVGNSDETVVVVTIMDDKDNVRWEDLDVIKDEYPQIFNKIMEELKNK